MNLNYIGKKIWITILLIGYLILSLLLSYKLQKNASIMILILIIAVILIKLLLQLKSRQLLWLVIVFNIIVGLLIDITGTGYIIFLNDLIIFVLLLKLLKVKKTDFKKINSIKIIFLLIVISLIINVFGAIIFKSKVLSAIYQIYSYYKYYIVLFIVIIQEWNIADLERKEKIIDIAILIQTPIVIVQYFTAPHADFMAGTFGGGGTGILMIYELFYISLISARFKYKRISVLKYISLLIIVLIPSVIAEIKFTMMLLPIAIGVVFIIGRINMKMIFSILLSIIITILGIKYMLRIYPEFSYMFESYDKFMWYVSEMSYGQDSLNRLSAIPYFNEYVFSSDINNLLGIGIGNGLAKGSSLIGGSFYLLNMGLKYEYFFLPYLYLEVGIIGTLMYLTIIICILVKILKYKSNNLSVNILNNTMVSFIVINLICLLYNQAMYMEQVGMIFWVLSGITIAINEKNRGV